MLPATSSRSGTVLIIVAGLCALLASLALTFLVRMRSDIHESTQFLAQTQARVMFSAALNYIGETSRIGWDDPDTPEHEEAFGWIDIRDGSVGPRDRSGKALYRAEINPALGKGEHWPAVGAWTICNSTHLWSRPPTAITAHVAPNPIQQDPSLAWSSLIGFAKASPFAVAGDYHAFIDGDPAPLAGSGNPCWFRVYRRKPSVFIITCGTGSSGGYRSWQEVVNAGKEAQYVSSDYWQTVRQSEPLFWYEVEWNSAVSSSSSGYIYKHDRRIEPANISKPFGNDTDQPNKRNQMGTFLYLQRLQQEPDNW
jgi:hypothetical protein